MAVHGMLCDCPAAKRAIVLHGLVFDGTAVWSAMAIHGMLCDTAQLYEAQLWCLAGANHAISVLHT
jgi:hypothetical protein